jgi:hypothetical protein
MKMTRRSFFGTASSAAAAVGYRFQVQMGGDEDNPGARASPGFLTATLTWDYLTKTGTSAFGEMLLPYAWLNLAVSLQENLENPIINVRLPEDKTSYQLAVAPDTNYYWAVIPADEQGEHPEASLKHHFTTAKPEIDDVDDDRIRYKNPRLGAHWQATKVRGVVQFSEYEALSPWYDRKSYLGGVHPSIDQAKIHLPIPILPAEKPLVDLYWYCWETLLHVWSFVPEAEDHQAVANIVGLRTWGAWGSTMAWDTSFILYFARYGHAAYPFIECLDNCYARQHENGFICREADKNNREVYALFPLNPPLFSWIEWAYYTQSNDAERLRKVLLPIVKHYEWWMKYQRRRNGLYWTDGFNEADDSPRNELMYYAVSANSYQALAALYAARIARRVGRNDIALFFEGEHTALRQLVNERFWDANHSIYNDLTKDGRFITELELGVLCKTYVMFWPLIAEIASEERIAGLVRELSNPKSFYRYSGVPSLSADSKGYRESGQYWHGAVWPPVQCIVQEGLRVCGRRELASDLAQKYLKALLEAYNREHTITENLAPDAAIGYGVKEFVGWGGIGPVSNLIEYVLGFHVNAPQNTIEWHITRPDQHGIENLAMGGTSVNLLCDERHSTNDSCHVICESSGDFVLKVFVHDKAFVYSIKKGRTELVVT